MAHPDVIDRSIADHQATIAALADMKPGITAAAEMLRRCLADGGTIFLMGNGGSAADSQHLAAEIVGRFKRERKGLAAIALTTDTSILTSVGNDYGFDFIFARQVEALCRPGDVLIGISTSGNSRNVVAGIEAGKRVGVRSIGLLGGNGGSLRQMCDLALVAPSPETARIQEAHILIGHILCELVEAGD
jgi:D-sedoheptulose 7-phosphate isomerase